MRILILSQWYPPEPAVLIEELAQTLHSLGHEIIVLTGLPNYPSGNLYPGYKIHLWQRETVAGILVTRVALYPDHSQSGLKRVLNYISFSLSATLLGWWKMPRPDVIFVYHPPLTVGLPAIILAKLWRIPFVYQVQDMWPETLQATGMVKNSTILRLVGGFAKWIYSRATTICVISPGFKQNLIAKGVPSEKIHVVSNWIDADLFDTGVLDPNLMNRLELNGHFNIMFAGNMGEAQELEAVVWAASMLGEFKDIQFVFVGDGVALPRLQALAKAMNLTNIRFLGRFPPQSMPQLYTSADVLLVHLKDDPLFRITIPHKILDYLGAGKPILAGVRGDAAQVVVDAGAGIVCEPEDPEAIAAAVRYLYYLPEDDRKLMGDNGVLAAKTIYSRNVLVEKVEALLFQVVEGY